MPALSAAVDELQAPRVYWAQGRQVEVDNEQIRRGIACAGAVPREER